MWNGRDAGGLNFAQEVNKREMGLPGVWPSLEPSGNDPSPHSVLIFLNDVSLSNHNTMETLPYIYTPAIYTQSSPLCF